MPQRLWVSEKANLLEGSANRDNPPPRVRCKLFRWRQVRGCDEKVLLGHVDLVTREERRMKKTRKLVAILLVAMAMTLSATATAHADAGDAAEDWTSYICYYLGFC